MELYKLMETEQHLPNNESLKKPEGKEKIATPMKMRTHPPKATG